MSALRAMSALLSKADIRIGPRYVLAQQLRPPRNIHRNPPRFNDEAGKSSLSGADTAQDLDTYRLLTKLLRDLLDVASELIRLRMHWSNQPNRSGSALPRNGHRVVVGACP